MDRFNAKWLTIPETNCWWWIACTARDGYGRFKLEGKKQIAHRVSYELHVGEIPDSMFVCHTCDNRLCVNPEHLFLGSHQDNMDDMTRKGRSPKGDSHYNCKLTDSDVIAIKKLHATGTVQRRIAEKFNCSFQHISDIVRGYKRI